MHMLVLRGWYAFEEPQRACDGLGGPLRVSESLRKPLMRLAGVGKHTERFGSSWLLLSNLLRAFRRSESQIKRNGKRHKVS